MRHALPSRVLPDLIRHPVETVGTRRVALGYASMGLRVEARKDTKALSTSCESTFIGLRKYVQWLMKVLSKIRCPCLHEITTYSDCPPPLFLITLHPKKNE